MECVGHYKLVVKWVCAVATVWAVPIAGPGKTDISAVPNMYQTINSCYGRGAATVNS